MYVHHRPDWPNFFWDADRLMPVLGAVRQKHGVLLGRVLSLDRELQGAAAVLASTTELLKSSEIEGVWLDEHQLRFAVERALGLSTKKKSAARIVLDVQGAVDVMTDATQRASEPVTAQRLGQWHASMFPIQPAARTRSVLMAVGSWRTGSEPMQIVSGFAGQQQVHFEAPAAVRIDREMQALLDWIELDRSQGSTGAQALDPVLMAGVAHLWFATIQPFDDGNGRMARALTELMLTRADGVPERFFSLSAQMRQERKAYYAAVDSAQCSSTLDITAWLEWFLGCFDRALDRSDEMLDGVMRQAAFWRTHPEGFNPRQRKVLNLLLSEGAEEVAGHLTSMKWSKLTRCSKDTAIRDINDLLARKLLLRGPEGGRSTRYVLQG